MYFSVFSIIIMLLILFFLFYTNGNLIKLYELSLSLYLIVSLNVDMGYFVRIGNSEISYNVFLLLFLLVLCVVIALTSDFTVSVKNLKNVSLLIFTICISISLMLAHPYQYPIVTRNVSWDAFVNRLQSKELLNVSDSGVAGVSLMFLEIIIVLLFTKQLFDEKQLNRIFVRVLSFSRLSLLVGLIEFIFKNMLNSLAFTDFLVKIFGNAEATHDFLELRGRIYSLNGLTKEPSFFANTLFYIAIMLMIYIGNRFLQDDSKLKVRSSKVALLFSLILLLINGSISIVIYLPILFVLMYHYFYNSHFSKSVLTKAVQYILYIFVGVVVLLSIMTAIDNSELLAGSSNYLFKRIGKGINSIKSWVIVGKYDVFSSSITIRFQSIIDTLKIIERRMLFGIGPSGTHAFSGVLTLIADIGLLGFFMWIKYVMNISNTKKGESLILAILILFIPNLVTNNMESFLQPYVIIILLIMNNALMKRKIGGLKYMGD